MKKLFISQPMRDKTDEEIKAERAKIVKAVTERFGEVDADSTIFQSTAPITVAVPIVAIKVCAIVLTALIPAALNHLTVSTFVFKTEFLNIFLPPKK